MFKDYDYGYDIKDYGYIGASTLGWGPADYTEEQIDKLMREENVFMETKELTKEELEKIMREENVLMETKELIKEELEKIIREENVLMEETKELTKLEKIVEEIRLAIKENTENKETKKGESNEKVVETPKVAKTPKMEFFEVEANSPATIKGIKYKGRIGIDISDFSFKICTASNQAVYKHARVFKGGENDPWKYWGKFRGVFKEPVNGRREAEFEFYAIGSRILVSYWKSEPYIRIARKLAAHTINKLNKVLK